jgi:hypothetical protein
MSQDNKWAQQKRAEREAEIKEMTGGVNLADKRKSFMEPKAKAAPASPSGGTVATPAKQRGDTESPAPVSSPPPAAAAVAVASSPSTTEAAAGGSPSTPLRSAMRKGDGRKRGVTVNIQADDNEEKKHTASGKKLVVEGRKGVAATHEEPKKDAAASGEDAEAQGAKEAENQAKLLAYKAELEEKKKKSLADMKRRAAELAEAKEKETTDEKAVKSD